MVTKDRMTSAAPEHITTSLELLAKAQEALGQDDLLQASEKGWGAAAHMVKGVAEKRGWPHHSHRELYQIVNRLAEETSEPALMAQFSIASSLHANFYELWMPREMVEEDLRHVRELLTRLEALS